MSKAALSIVQVTGARREVAEAQWLSAAERVHRQLRPQLIAYLEKVARDRGCPGMDLDSGTHRTRAHRFYFREGFFITAFSFRKEFQ